MSKGTHEEFLLHKLFNEFDLNRSGYLSLDDLYAMLIKLDIAVEKKYLHALFNVFDTNKSGYISYKEFVYFIHFDTYP